jgi:hypothetical protein
MALSFAVLLFFPLALGLLLLCALGGGLPVEVGILRWGTLARSRSGRHRRCRRA